MIRQSTPTPLELAYCAGFFDGEGTVAISKPEGTSYYLLRCSASNTERSVLVLFKTLFGGSIKGPYKRTDRSKPIFVWNADAAVAERFLELVSPYLVLKKDRAEKALKFRELFKGDYILPRGNADLSNPAHAKKKKDVLTLRERAYTEMRNLNRRGENHAERN